MCPRNGFVKLFLRLLDLSILIWQRSGKAKIAEEDPAAAIDQHVGRFNVPMDDVGLVKILEGAQRIVEHHLNVFFRNLHLGRAVQ